MRFSYSFGCLELTIRPKPLDYYFLSTFGIENRFFAACIDKNVKIGGGGTKRALYFMLDVHELKVALGGNKDVG